MDETQVALYRAESIYIEKSQKKKEKKKKRTEEYKSLCKFLQEVMS